MTVDEHSPVLDAHVHVWDPARLPYPWLAGVPALNRPVTLDERADGDPRTRWCLLVEADARRDQALAEAGFMVELARSSGRDASRTDVADRPDSPPGPPGESGQRPDPAPEVVGVVAAVDLRSPTLAADLCALLALGQVVGVRHLLQHEPDGALADPLLARGLAVVAEAGLVFDACVRHEQLDALVRLLAASPATRVMLDHLGKPPVRAGLGSPSGAAWAHAIDRLAARPETWVKLSGLAPECASRDELDRHGGDLLRHALAAFGPDRAVLASDWPVSATLGAAVTPAEWWTWVATEADLGPAGWRAVAEGTARRAYRLSHA
ncbi:hypothetical protein FH969_10625 [Miniimonas arenae]|uniref:Amidohydrolase-related domain-containing protein n=1 Tax=Miniimonas arenae TaxID=676201 RepID=A0A5C5BAR1_9MICO|nr:amidohydrolase family protein [Miniimonas arenae]TNU73569.1 hypothetical protein FH969_10625 [Miniimonas arenae]